MDLATLIAQQPPATTETGGFLTQLGWIDMVGLGLTGLLVVLGFVRGLWWQVIRLVGVLAAVVIARTLSPRWVPTVQGVFEDMNERLTHGIVWLLVFVAALGLATLLGRLGRKMLEAMQLGLVDRFGGAFVGALTGLVVHAAVLVSLTHLGPSDWVVSTLSGTYSDRFLDSVGRRWPVVMAKERGEELRSLIYGEGAPVEGAPVEPGGAPGGAAPPAAGGK